MSKNENENNNEIPMEIYKAKNWPPAIFYLILLCATIIYRMFLITDHKYSRGVYYNEQRIENVLDHLKNIGESLKRYKQNQGAYPTNAEGLLALTDLKANNTIDWGFEGPNELYRTKSGILSPWKIPFMYENRNGLDSDLFKDSPATRDTNGNYSIKVDNNIFVYSVGAKVYYEECVSLKYEQYTIIAIFLIVSLFFGILFIREVIHNKFEWIGGVGFFAAVAAFIFGYIINDATCYIMMRTFYSRPPEMQKEYNALMEKYRERGIIKQETYDKLKKSFDKELNKRRQTP